MHLSVVRAPALWLSLLRSSLLFMIACARHNLSPTMPLCHRFVWRVLRVLDTVAGSAYARTRHPSGRHPPFSWRVFKGIGQRRQNGLQIFVYIKKVYKKRFEPESVIRVHSERIWHIRYPFR